MTFPPEPPAPLKACERCEQYAHQIAMIRPPNYHEERTELATDLLLHRSDPAAACPNRFTGVIPVAGFDPPARPCMDCAELRHILRRYEAEHAAADTEQHRAHALQLIVQTQRDLTRHRTREQCPGVTRAKSTPASGM